MARNPVHGVLLLDKPVGLSSHAALSRAKRALGAAKGGHTGTLDPLASGLLPLCFGEATKFASDLLEATKSYRATVKLGVTTTTGDAEGAVQKCRPVAVDLAQIAAALERFRGPISQIPPMYSALKRDGRPYYEYARQGVTLERPARQVVIYALRASDFHGDSLALEATVSKGTYIRTLAEDLGEALGCGAHLTALRRTAIGALELAQSTALADFEALAEPARHARLLPVDSLVLGLPEVRLSAAQTTQFRHGQRISAGSLAPGERVRVYGQLAGGEAFLGVGCGAPDGALQAVRLLNTGLDSATPGPHH